MNAIDPLSPPLLEFFANLSVQVDKPIMLASSDRGMRRVVPILGGTAKGDGWTARVLPGGTDYQLIVSDTMSELDARYGLETDAGDLIYVQNHALRSAPPEVMARLLRGEPVDPTQVYFRCSPRFETSSKSLGWIAYRMFVGVGVRHPAEVVMRFFCLA